jgi:predicted aspartyl protease
LLFSEGEAQTWLDNMRNREHVLDAAAFHIAAALVDGDLLRRAEQLITEHQDSDATTNYSVQMGSAGELVAVDGAAARHGHFSANQTALGDGKGILTAF